MINSFRSIALTLGVLTLVGCGGGGDGGGDNPTQPLAAITSDNAPVIASAVMSASQNGNDLGSFVFSGPTLTPMSSHKTIQAYSTITQIQDAQIKALVKHAQVVVHAPVGPETTACTGGGSVTLSGNISNAGTLSPNDSIAFDFQSCIEGETTINGRFSMRVTTFNGDLESGVFSFAVTVDLSSFQVTVNGETATVDGSVSLAISATASGTLTTTVTASSLSVSGGGANHTLSGYSSTRVLTAGAFSLDESGTLTSSAFSGTVTFDTTALLQGTDGSFSDQGQLLITGANGGTIKIIVLDGTLVRLEVDTNGDGTPDATIDRTWDDLT